MQIDFITIWTKDLEESIRFYEDVLEFRLLQRLNPSPGIKIAFMGDGGENKIELIESEAVEIPVKPHFALGFEVDDIDDMKEFLEEMGVQITGPPRELPNGTKLMQGVDFNGLGLNFVQEMPMDEDEDLLDF